MRWSELIDLDAQQGERAGSVYFTKSEDMRQPTMAIYFLPLLNIVCDSARGE
jgi:hypothetical protein